ncbi:MAG: Bax inhibitor-1/YccA family protein [Candidatus Omnitrophota bacterium]
MRTSNPALRSDVFSNVGSYGSTEVMTIQGTTNKSFALLFIILISASWIWSEPQKLMPLFWPAMIGSVIMAILTIFKKEWAQVTAPIYAVFEGVLLGGISAFFEKTYPGIVIQAVGLTFGTLFSLLFVYKTRLIKVTDNFRLGVFAAIGGIAVYYFISMILSFFKIQIPLIYDSGPLGIGFSLFVVVIAALNLVLDFDFIEKGVQSGAPKYMEWYGAFGLMVTLVWLYLEILRLLAKTRRR